VKWFAKLRGEYGNKIWGTIIRLCPVTECEANPVVRVSLLVVASALCNITTPDLCIYPLEVGAASDKIIRRASSLLPRQRWDVYPASKVKRTRQEGLARASAKEVASHESAIGKPRLLI